MAFGDSRPQRNLKMQTAIVTIGFLTALFFVLLPAVVVGRLALNELAHKWAERNADSPTNSK
jgi:hypothetical protein